MRASRITPARICGLLSLVLVVFSAWTLTAIMPGGIEAIAAPGNALASILFRYTWLPRLFAALLGGAGLGLAGALMQQTLRNPLAAPTTLGVISGVQLALLLATLFAPALLLYTRGLIGFLGGVVALGLVLTLAWRHALAPTVVVLAGLVVNLFLGALVVVLLLFNQQALHGLMIWGAGSLTQNNWHGVLYLLPRLGIGAVAATILSRALALLDLDDASARNLGVSLAWLRAGALSVAVFLSAVVVVKLGVIGFIGLAAPSIVRLAGARRLSDRLIWAPALGALLLAATDQILQLVTHHSAALIPTGATTAVLGAPLLLWLIPRLTMRRSGPPTKAGAPTNRARRPYRLILALAVAIAPVIVAALLLGPGAHGWTWPFALPWAETGAWRLPRVLAAGSAGVMLALAGTIIQRVSGNPMASPEVLGVTAGTAMGVLAVILIWPAASTLLTLAAGILGAFATLVLLAALNARSGFEPERVLLTGVSVLFLYDAVSKIVLASSDPRIQQALAWMSGTTYYIHLPLALVAGAIAVIGVLATLPFAAWLDLLPLGVPVARSLGVNAAFSRLLLLAMAAVLTAVATLVVGPLSFVGLLAPHMARMLGLTRAREHLLGSLVIGGLLMILADWVGRVILFPSEIPAGLVATLIGGSYFMWRLRRF
ncbi:Fe(3+)-hydroxamate ABC transporter permease FhuB [Salinisphaera orenii]|uniref:Fe(3+)-hydroxamate ABC transporter permease FhuB n=1 Tax=Salinisphaera orenii TaxID=856731 RepID=UPI00296E37E5